MGKGYYLVSADEEGLRVDEYSCFAEAHRNMMEEARDCFDETIMYLADNASMAYTPEEIWHAIVEDGSYNGSDETLSITECSVRYYSREYGVIEWRILER